MRPNAHCVHSGANRNQSGKNNRGILISAAQPQPRRQEQPRNTRNTRKQAEQAFPFLFRGFSAAFREFPFHVGVLYSGPQQLGPANLLWSEPTRYHATMVGFPYDDLDAWRAVYPPEIFIQQLEKVLNCRDLLAHWLPRLRASHPSQPNGSRI